MIDAEYKQQIERALGRPLISAELVRVDELAHLTITQRRVAAELARRQLVLCAHYLRAVAPINAGEMSRFVDELLNADLGGT